MNRREFVGSIMLSAVTDGVDNYSTTCSVCEKRGFTAKQADVVEKLYGKYMGGTCCYNSTEEQLYIHPKWLK